MTAPTPEALALVARISATEPGTPGAAWHQIVARATLDFLDGKVAAGELVRLPNGNYLKRAEWEARQRQPIA